MTRPQRRSASLRAFPELGLVMRRPGVAAPPASIACLGGFHEVRSGRGRRLAGQPSAVSWRGGLPRPSEPVSDGRAQPTALGGRSCGLGLRVSRGPHCPLLVEARGWAPEAERLTLALRRSGAGRRVCEAAIRRAVLAGGLQGAPTQRASVAPRSRPGRASARRSGAIAERST